MFHMSCTVTAKIKIKMRPVFLCLPTHIVCVYKHCDGGQSTFIWSPIPWTF